MYPSVINHDIDASECRNGLVNRTLGSGNVTHVSLNRYGTQAKTASRAFRLFTSGNHYHPAPLLVSSSGDCSPYTSGRASDQPYRLIARVTAHFLSPIPTLWCFQVLIGLNLFGTSLN
jgi:hypothetical protein